LYAVVHEFLVSVIEGDEAYTKVQKNVPPDQSPGWTILLMDRASRFIWALECGKKDRKLFTKVIKSLDKIARQTNDLSIFTDGERRYGNLLFEICHELVKNGKPGRPKKTFKRGVHFRIKNKGAQVHNSELTSCSRNTNHHAALQAFAIFTFTLCSTWFVMTRNRSACCS